MKYCKNCASVQDESLTYCPYCGGMLSGEMPGNQGGPIGGFDMSYGNRRIRGPVMLSLGSRVRFMEIQAEVASATARRTGIHLASKVVI